MQICFRIIKDKGTQIIPNYIKLLFYLFNFVQFKIYLGLLRCENILLEFGMFWLSFKKWFFCGII
jgi:hypothetical protein